ncbi:uncharacterized protein LOC111705450 isoform X2 [Eurytemora carolleeae]|uniref:uncharacterized protein LOC111705450 isoform X2 n=1 Tax=Eurytemora carolleeae TaxID=1294199 RepID=UPI000C76D216|nr:uncharacterized protein LOC111705450 isoform X2 [Eurytemora carolleeae]|eukprot:XP_023333772.1 uncharacterized protein LOC111705450 isoform X2 [Eurytemora affinis]
MWKPTVAIMLILGCVEETVGDRRREENGDMDWRNNGGSRRSSITSDNIRESLLEDESKSIGRERKGRKNPNQPFIYNISIAKFNRSPDIDVHEDELVDNLKTILSLQPLLQTRFQDDRFSPQGSSAVQGTRFSPLEIATSAGCEPELRTVEVKVENLTDTSFYYPTCTR